MINKRIGKRKRKIVALFVDLRTAFDSVDRGVLFRVTRERGIREGLTERMEEMMREQSKDRKRDGKVFWTARGMRQRYPSSPILFNLLLADLEEEMGKS